MNVYMLLKKIAGLLFGHIRKMLKMGRWILSNPMRNLKEKKISFVRQRKDVYETLGPRSRADSATILSFGTLFTSPYKGSESYIDIREAPKDQKIQSLINKIEFLPFVPEILDAGKTYALHTIKSPFLCAQLRLLDGQFKNHRSATFVGLKQKL
nr:O-fucosyltransferase 30 [Tanacetum cinerariifolium]